MASGQGSGTQTAATSILTLAEVKTHLRVDHSNEDTHITRLRDAAVVWCQEFTRRQFINATKTLVMDGFPAVIYPPVSSLVSVTTVSYEAPDNTTTTLSSSGYDVDITREPGRIVTAFGESWPATRAEINAVTVTYVAGYGASTDDTPDAIKTAVLMLIAHLYENRESVILAVRIEPFEVPMGVKMLLGPYRVLFEFPHMI